jgi:hypothetical protein
MRDAGRRENSFGVPGAVARKESPTSGKGFADQALTLFQGCRTGSAVLPPRCPTRVFGGSGVSRGLEDVLVPPRRGAGSWRPTRLNGLHSRRVSTVAPFQAQQSLQGRLARAALAETPRVLPFRSSMDTPSTAFTYPRTRRRKPVFTGNHTSGPGQRRSPARRVEGGEFPVGFGTTSSACTDATEWRRGRPYPRSPRSPRLITPSGRHARTLP